MEHGISSSFYICMYIITKFNTFLMAFSEFYMYSYLDEKCNNTVPNKVPLLVKTIISQIAAILSCMKMLILSCVGCYETKAVLKSV